MPVQAHVQTGTSMYIDRVSIYIWSLDMALQIANPVVVEKATRMAQALGVSKTAVVERALDRLACDIAPAPDMRERAAALLAQLDRIPERPDAIDPLQWDEMGLPR
jgi:antitoxin VapB